MGQILVRGIPEADMTALDERAQRLGRSRDHEGPATKGRRARWTADQRLVSTMAGTEWEALLEPLEHHGN